MRQQRVLVIEDELMVGLDVVFQLEDAGFAPVEHVATEAEALHLLATKTWDIVVADANLNGRSIEPVIRLLHEKALPFVIVSGYDRESLPAVIGDAPILSKPVRSEHLIHTVKNLCSPNG